jgi:hypothetical protein
VTTEQVISDVLMPEAARLGIEVRVVFDDPPAEPIGHYRGALLYNAGGLKYVTPVVFEPDVLSDPARVTEKAGRYLKHVAQVVKGAGAGAD